VPAASRLQLRRNSSCGRLVGELTGTHFARVLRSCSPLRCTGSHVLAVCALMSVPIFRPAAGKLARACLYSCRRCGLRSAAR